MTFGVLVLRKTVSVGFSSFGFGSCCLLQVRLPPVVRSLCFPLAPFSFRVTAQWGRGLSGGKEASPMHLSSVHRGLGAGATQCSTYRPSHESCCLPSLDSLPGPGIQLSHRAALAPQGWWITALICVQLSLEWERLESALAELGCAGAFGVPKRPRSSGGFRALVPSSDRSQSFIQVSNFAPQLNVSLVLSSFMGGCL